MTKRMLIDAAHAGETRVAILDDDMIVDYDFTTTAKTQIKGNIYLAKITRVEPSLQAAFVEYGGGKQGFLPFAEIHPDYYQLPAEDKQKLLAEQIAEAEAEEAAEEEAFEREQAAREARGRHRGESDSEEEEDFESDALLDADAEAPVEEPAAGTLKNARSHLAALIANPPAMESAEVPALTMPQAFAPEEPGEPYNVAPLEAESFAVHSDALDAPADAEAPSAADAAAQDAPIDAHADTTSEEAEETRGRRRDGSAKQPAIHRRYRIQEVIKRNQIVLVQVIKEERGNKGCSLTSYISLAGRCAVLMPNSPKGGGISRKITDRETRKRLKEVASEMRTHRGMSVIIRTAGIDRTKAEIRRDYEYLIKLWNQVRETTLGATAPSLIYEEGNLIKRALRDQYSGDMGEVIVEGEEAFREAKDFMKMLMPSHVARVKLYKDSMPLFAYAGVEEQLTGMMDPQVKLPSGGYIVIHSTEALIAIDVNSGRSTTERNVEETALKTNLEAAAEAARQLRLRDLAGLIVVDFIDMNYGKNRKAVERAMKDALKSDRAKIQLGRISMFGLMELSRQRMRPSISEATGVQCPHCRGTGYIHSVETVAIQIIRTLEKEAATGEYVTLRVTTHPEAALYLLNENRALLQSLEQRYHVNVVVLMDTAIITGHFRLIKVNQEGKESLHEDSKQPRQRRTRGGRGRNNRGGDKPGHRSGLSFDGAVEPVEEADLLLAEQDSRDDDHEVIGRKPRETSSEDREDRPKRERGRRGGRNRNRERGPREPRTPQLDENGNPVEVQAAEPREQREPRAPREPREPQLDENGNPIERPARDGARRRGRRGGRSRNRSDRPDRAHHDIAEVAAAVVDQQERASKPVTAPAPAAPASEPKSFVIPISDAQTNPATAPASSAEPSDKPKRKGWFTRVMEG
jgi:ribonuclease E